MPMPTRPLQHQIRDLAENILSKLLLKQNWVIVSRQNQNDYGVDLDIQLVHEEQVTGKFFFCQLKGTKNITWTEDRHSLYLEKGKAHYLLALNIPSVIVLVDTTTEEIYWKSPFDHRETDNKLVFDFHRDRQRLDDDIVAFSAYIREWIIAFAFDNVMCAAPQFHCFFVELWEHAQWSPDWGHRLAPEMDAKFRGVYNHIMQLRLLSGISLPFLIPMSIWELRNESFPGYLEEVFFHQVFKEAMQYIRYRYQEVVDKIKSSPSRQFPDKLLHSYFKGIDRVECSSESIYRRNHNCSSEDREYFNKFVETSLKKLNIDQSFSYEDAKAYHAQNRRFR